jgi:hypothetical protein
MLGVRVGGTGVGVSVRVGVGGTAVTVGTSVIWRATAVVGLIVGDGDGWTTSVVTIRVSGSITITQVSAPIASTLTATRINTIAGIPRLGSGRSGIRVGSELSNMVIR